MKEGELILSPLLNSKSDNFCLHLVQRKGEVGVVFGCALRCVLWEGDVGCFNVVCSCLRWVWNEGCCWQGLCLKDFTACIGLQGPALWVGFFWLIFFCSTGDTVFFLLGVGSRGGWMGSGSDE